MSTTVRFAQHHPADQHPADQHPVAAHDREAEAVEGVAPPGRQRLIGALDGDAREQHEREQRHDERHRRA